MQERRFQCRYLRDIIFNPFRHVSFIPAWSTPNLTSLLQTAYDERVLPSGVVDSARLTTLADTLEESGCTNADIQSHCREPRPHVRGCWALDLMLEKK